MSSGGRSKSSNGTRPANSSNNSNNNYAPAVNNRSSSNVRANARPNGSAQEKRKIVGQYMLGKTIGEGTFGKVKLAIHIPTGEKVAVKILEKSRIKEQADVRRVNREIKILKKSRHGNIIQLYEVLDTQNTIYLIMECADGGEMFDFIVAQKHVPEIQACKFFHQIIDGVEVLHNNDITHRDLKPENLLLKASTDGWLVKIVDFGLSNTHEGNKLLSTACGSPCYAAPEMIAGKKYNGPLADLWSIGVILFALVCGFLPFEDANTSVLYKKIMSGDYKPPKWISAEVRDLIRCILEVDPRKRYTVADIRKHPWYSIVSDASIPREVVNVAENELIKADIMKSIALAGMDTQAVLDGVASHACNSLTAMFYLLEQKHKIMKLKQHTNRGSIINQSPRENGSNHSSNQNESAPPESVVPVRAGVLDPLTSNSNQNPPQSEQPLIPKMPLLPKTQLPSTDVTPYRQTPVILQQHFNNGSNNNTNNGVINNNSKQMAVMPSLDHYLKTGVGFPNLTNLIANNNNNNNAAGALALNGLNPTAPLDANSSRNILKDKVRPGGPRKQDIPKLNLPAFSSENDANGNVLVSQTSRPPIHSSQQPQQYLSARPAVTTSSEDGGAVTKDLLEMMSGAGLGGEGVDRPTTRRSHVRSRGDADNNTASAGDAMGKLATTPMQPQQNLTVGIAGGSVKTGSVLASFDSNGYSTVSAPVAASIPVPKAPDQATSSVVYSGGRKGRNISDPSRRVSDATNTAAAVAAVRGDETTNTADANVVNVMGPVPTIPATVAVESSTSPRFMAMRNKLAAQGSLGPIAAPNKA
mmetsp:Transcript_9382/g.12974  ORF Transcript_9382/g.12974 Transcript_9382/m.12974 type:complete len:812 (+) Transcript_9382:111-2546(+)